MADPIISGMKLTWPTEAPQTATTQIADAHTAELVASLTIVRGAWWGITKFLADPAAGNRDRLDALVSMMDRAIPRLADAADEIVDRERPHRASPRALSA